ncbi:hypothetical protein N7465_001205 [Penicillium sp. CMV-2018d]|nr:hypothetical protein N7465_001205 [Penicillium sp. CMV-2018d]
MATTLHKSRRAKPPQLVTSEEAFILFIIGIYSFVVYIAAPIYTPSEDASIKEFCVNNTEGSPGLALYIYVKGYNSFLGYGAGPLFFSPLSEISRIGRNLPYIITFFLSCIAGTPAALVPNANLLPAFPSRGFRKSFPGHRRRLNWRRLLTRRAPARDDNMGILRLLCFSHRRISIWFRNPRAWLEVLNVGDVDGRWSHSRPVSVDA